MGFQFRCPARLGAKNGNNTDFMVHGISWKREMKS